MKHTLKTFLILALLSLSAAAQSIITTTVTVTNAAPIGSTYTFNASTRTFATNFSSTTIQTNATIGGTATNLFLHLISSVPSGPVRISMPATNQVAIEGALNQAITASLLTNWGSIAYSTQAVQAAFSVRVPMSAEPTATNRVRFSSWLIDALRDYPTNSFPGTAFALTNFLSTTNNGRTISGSNTFTGANVFSNSGQSIVGGTISNAVFVGGNITNSGANVYRGTNTFGTIAGTNGNILNGLTVGQLIATNGAQLYQSNNTQVVIGLGADAGNTTNSIAIGQGAIAGAFNAIAMGNGTEAQATNSIAIGREATTVFTGGIAIGSGSYSGNTNATALGFAASAAGSDSIAIGISATADQNNSIVIGNNLTSTDTNQVLIGGAGVSLAIPGTASFSNTVVIGTAERYTSPTGFTYGLQMLNGTGASADPTNAAVINSVSGSLRYRTSGSNEGSGTNNYLHNRTAEVIGSGSDYSLTTSYALVDFGGTDVEFNTLPTAGTYLLTATVAVNVGNTTGDDFSFKFYNATDAADVANSEQVFDGTGHSGILQLTLSTVVSATGPKRIQIYGKNGTANRGSVTAIYTKAIYVRLY
jgi:hypothetical protein